MTRAILVHANNDILAAIDPRLASGRGLLDPQLGHTRIDGLGHAAERVNLPDEFTRSLSKACRQVFDIVAAAERVDDMGYARLFRDHELRVARDPRREGCR